MAPYQKTNASCRALCACLRWHHGAAAFVQEACRAEAAEQRRLVGLGRLELPTSRLSSARSNQLSYKPLTLSFLKRIVTCSRATGSHRMVSTSAAPGACSSAKKEKRRRRNPANGAQRSGDRWPLMFLKRSDRQA